MVQIQECCGNISGKAEEQSSCSELHWNESGDIIYVIDREHSSTQVGINGCMF